MKHVRNGPIDNYRGTNLQAPKRDEHGSELKEDNGQTQDADVRVILDLLIERLPIATLTRQDSIHITRLWSQVHKDGAGVPEEFDIEDAEWEWLIGKFEDPRITAQIFGASSYVVERQLRDYVVTDDPQGGLT